LCSRCVISIAVDLLYQEWDANWGSPFHEICATALVITILRYRVIKMEGNLKVRHHEKIEFWLRNLLHFSSGISVAI